MDTTVPAPVARRSRADALAPLSGVIAVALFLLGAIVHDVIGDTPGGDDPASTFARYYQEEDGSIWGASIFISLGIVFFFFFLGALRAELYEAEGGVGRKAATAFAGGIATAVLILAAFGTQLSAAILVADRDLPIDPGVAVAFWWIGDGVFVGAFYTAAVLLAASGVVFLQHGLLPRWFGWITLLLALLLVIPFINWAGFFVFGLWVIVASVMLWRAAGRSAA